MDPYATGLAAVVYAGYLLAENCQFGMLPVPGWWWLQEYVAWIDAKFRPHRPRNEKLRLIRREPVWRPPKAASLSKLRTAGEIASR